MSINSYDDEQNVRRVVAGGGHRDLIGGLWEEMGDLQLSFLRARGLMPSHTLLDVGCGAGRFAVRVVPYLDVGRYFGIDLSPTLLDSARDELRAIGQLERLGAHALTTTADFTPHPDTPPIDIAIAQSVFTHLPLDAFGTCLAALAPRMSPGGRFFATFFVAPEGAGATRHEPGGAVTYPDADPFHFTVDAILEQGRTSQWSPEWIGGWNHPRDQQMCMLTARA